MRYLLTLTLILLSAISFHSCQSNSSTPSNSTIQVSDASGTLVSLPVVAEKVICLFEPILDELYMLGMGKKVQGIPLEILSDADYYQYYAKLDQRIFDKTIATPGTESSPNVEKIVSLKPDLVILESNQTKIADRLRAINIPVYLCISQEYENIIHELKDIALLTGAKARADSLIMKVEKELNYINENKNHTKEPKRAYFTWAYGKIFSTIGQNGMMNTCLKLAGVKNVCNDPMYRVDITPERLISWNPDLIITWNDSASKFYNRKEFQSINAIKNRSVHNLLPMFFFNPHNIKAICTALRINGIAYGNLPSANGRIHDFLQFIYGEKLANNGLIN